MDSRIDGNETTKKTVGSRTERNKELYKEVSKTELSRIRTNNNIRVIDDQPKEIDIEKIKNYINKMNDDEPKRKSVVVDPVNTGEIKLDEKEEDKVYDINAVLEKAKEEKQTTYEEEKHKKLRDTEFDILSKLDVDKTKTVSLEDKEDNSEENNEIEDSEKTLMDLINTVTIAKEDTDLFSELTSSDDSNDEKTAPIEEEIEKAESQEVHISKIPNEAKQEIKVIEEKIDKNAKEKEEKQEIDKSFYTNSMSFSKKDFEGFEDIESSVKKNNTLVVLAIIMLLIVIAFTGAIICNYVFELGWF